MEKGGLRISKPLTSAHLQSGGVKTRSNCVERKKLGKGHRFHFPWELICFQEKGNKSALPQPPTRSDVPLAQFHQTGTSRAGARLQETLPITLLPQPLRSLHPEAWRVTSAPSQQSPGEHTNTDSMETKPNQIRSNHLYRERSRWKELETTNPAGEAIWGRGENDGWRAQFCPPPPVSDMDFGSRHGD